MVLKAAVVLPQRPTFAGQTPSVPVMHAFVMEDATKLSRGTHPRAPLAASHSPSAHLVLSSILLTRNNASASMIPGKRETLGMPKPLAVFDALEALSKHAQKTPRTSQLPMTKAGLI